MGETYKYNPLTGKFDLVLDENQIGSTSTYIEVDTTNHRIRFYLNGTLVDEWS